MSLDVTVTDLFCGAGGSSIGAEAAGATLRMAANHWRLAIETHNSNFPNADHDCADVSQVDPRRYPRTDVLIASPECTNHSSAKRKATRTLWEPNSERWASEERSRATMWDVCRFTEQHRYELVIVENVVEARNWEGWRGWLQAMHDFGYDHRACYLNSMVAHPTPQSRDRMYVVFWKQGNHAPDLDFRPLAWCAACEHDVEGIQSWKNPLRQFGKYRSQYVYRCPTCAGISLPYAWPAAAAIDWSLPTPRIGDRERPLADATLQRIRAGLDRYGFGAVVQAAGHTYERPGYYRTWPLWEPLGTQTTTAQHGLVVDTAYGGDPSHILPSSDPFATQTGQQSRGLVLPMRGAQQAHRADDGPIGTQVASSSEHALVVPLRTNGTAFNARHEPMRTMVAGNNGHAVVTLRGTDESAIASSTHPVEDPIGTVSAGGVHHALLVRNYTPRGNAAQMVTPIGAPTGTVTTSDHHSLLIPYNSTGPAEPVTKPHRTMDTRDRYGLVEPHIQVDDCGFRMLEPHEIGRAMAFPDTYEVKGNKRERVRQYGNAVTPPVMALILARAIGSLAS